MKKILTVALSIVLSLVLLTGCVNNVYEITVDENGDGQFVMTEKLDKKACDEYLDEFGLSQNEKEELFQELFNDDSLDFKVESIDGKEYYVAKNAENFTGHSELQLLLENAGLKDVYVLRNGNGIRFINEGTTDETSFLFDDDQLAMLYENMSATYAITMPETIIKYSPNGVLSDDGKTVTFTTKGSDFSKPVEYMLSLAAEEKAPRITNVKDGKTYSVPVELRVKDESGIESATYTVNGKTNKLDLVKKFVKNGEYTVTAADYYGNSTTKSFVINDKQKPTFSGVEKCTVNKPYNGDVYATVNENCELSSVKLTRTASGKTTTKKLELLDKTTCDVSVTSSGKYKLVAKDVNGNTNTIEFVVDKIKPTVKGVKNNGTYKKAVTVTYSDNIKVKSAKLNGKSFTSGKKVSKKGKYTVVVKDTAGNKRTVKFTIK